MLSAAFRFSDRSAVNQAGVFLDSKVLLIPLPKSKPQPLPAIDMEKYSPPIRERDNKDLLEIFLSPKGDWQDDAVQQAIEELLIRGYSNDELKKISYDFQIFLEQENKIYQAQLEQNAKESYTILKMITIFFCTPIILNSELNFFKDMTISELKRENYKIKYRQRIFLLIGGCVFYFILIKIFIF